VNPCTDCLSIAWLLGEVGGHIETMPPRSRPRGLLTLEPEAMIHLLGGKRSASLRKRLSQFDPDAAIDRIDAAGLKAACCHSGQFEWPNALVIDPEPPAVLHVAGDAGLLARPSVAVVGARRADAYGREVARQLASQLAAAGICVVSGLALGIDGAAHRGALDVERGLTTAVLGGGADRCYPRKHLPIYREIVDRGCVVSEMPPGTAVWRWSFPARNRLIASLSKVVAVVQAAVGSGSLHTAEAALERSVTVAAIPGLISNPLSHGTNRLLADGALVICSAEQLLEQLGLQRVARSKIVPHELRELMQRLEAGPVNPPDAASRGEAAEFNSRLAQLELLGLARRMPGGSWVASG